MIVGKILREIAGSLKGMARELSLFIFGMGQAMREHSVEALQLQYLEMENTFLTIVMGGLVGMPFAPLALSMELAPLLKEEIAIMERRHALGGDLISDYFSSMGGDW
ncbi:MAG: hypothetical protein F7C08_00895 [Desulfurococcales archaeon]|nr:hypothetical protein [Desulfurococcales archaeon]MCE4605078.1 hypothetical protein [Desulfurococcales archaeon]